MDLDELSREKLIQRIEELQNHVDNVIVLWGGKRELRSTLAQVAENKDGEYTQEEARNAEILVRSDEVFNEFIEMIRNSFERGGINYLISEKISDLMEEVASRRK
jgi:predicted ATP-grasp superfamily ATP-dependent carboligase